MLSVTNKLIKMYKMQYYTPIATSRLYDKIQERYPVKYHRSSTQSSSMSRTPKNHQRLNIRRKTNNVASVYKKKISTSYSRTFHN